MSGDYLALLLRDGYAELRLDCGTGPGSVRSSERVRLNRWNRLTGFRHDWGVWMQLNNGRHDEGRSQGEDTSLYSFETANITETNPLSTQAFSTG